MMFHCFLSFGFPAPEPPAEKEPAATAKIREGLSRRQPQIEIERDKVSDNRKKK